MKILKYCCLITLSGIIIFIMSCTDKVKSFEFSSEFYRMQLVDTFPFVKYFSVDAMGKSMLSNNPVKWRAEPDAGEFELHKISDSEVYIYNKGTDGPAIWKFEFDEKKFTATSNYVNEKSVKSLAFRFEKKRNHTTLLGVMVRRNATRLPALIHFPDMGTFSLVADRKSVV